ncbi:hypothetical protein MasN3_43720 [Massilia varians]|uniref:Uncharacterized protein n=1 Tax=Massilia varians TaxID=457921 RepID=A0ABM8CC37_9BURK|nr:calcium-binding protein [Massilia varians]BDT60878.1 hypothetical protein MasN3_43720 [Massilia varians]
MRSLRALADVAEAAAGKPSTLDSLLRGGGMQKVLEVMPAEATLDDVADALATGGMPAAVEVVYPTPQPPELSMSLQNGVLTFIGTSTDTLEIDLDTHTVTRAGKKLALDAAALNDVSATDYAGTVIIKGSVEKLAVAMAAPSGVDAYQIVDVKGAIFGGTPDAPSFASVAVRKLIAEAKSVTIADALSIKEYQLLESLAGFDLSQLAADVDRLPPSLSASIHSVSQGAGDNAADFVTNVADATVRFTLSGALDKGDYVQYSVDGGQTWSTVAADKIDGTSVRVAVDATANPVVQVRVVDAAGNPGVASAAQQITYDGTAATQTVTIVSISQDDGDSPDLTPDFTTNVAFATVQATLSAALAAGDYVQYSLDQAASWIKLPAANIAGTAVRIEGVDVTGSPTLRIRVVDAAGNPGNAAEQKISYDNVKAGQTVSFVSISEDTGQDSPDNMADYVTNQGQITVKANLSAVLAAGEYVQYSVGGAWITLGAAAVAGQSVSIEGIDATTSPTVSIRVVDAAGNPGDATTQKITYDNVKAGQTVSFVSLTGHAPTDFITNQPNVTLEATLSAQLGLGEYVQVSLDGGLTWTMVPGGAIAGTSVSIAGLDATASPTVSLRVVDAAGNPGTAAAQRITYDNEAATQTVTILSISQDQGIDGSADNRDDFTTNIASATVKASLSAGLAAGDYVQYSLDQGASWIKLPAANITGTAVRIEGVDVTGSPELRIRVVDAAGNPGAPAAQAITYDNVAPVFGARFDSLSKGEGDIAPAFTTNQEYATVAVTLLTALEDHAYVQVSVDGGQNWIKADDAHAQLFAIGAPAGPRATLDGLTLTVYDVHAPSTPTLQIRAVDVAGNPSTVLTQDIVYDGTAPATTVSLLSISQGEDDLTPDFVTNVANATLGAQLSSALAAGERLQYSTDGATWTTVKAEQMNGTVVSIAGIDTTGSPTLSLRLIDAAGNSTQPVSRKVTYDNTAPAKPSLALLSDTGMFNDDGVTSKGTVRVTGLDTDGATFWQYSLNGGVNWNHGGGGNTGGSADLLLSGDGVKNVVVRQVDAVGNASAISTALQFTLDTSKPANALSFSTVEQPNGSGSVSGLAQAKVYFTYTGALDANATLQWRLANGTWATVGADAIDGATGTVTVGPVNLGNGAQVVELRQVDLAGNENFVSQRVEGPPVKPPVTTTYDFNGVHVQLATPGSVMFGHVPSAFHGMGNTDANGKLFLGEKWNDTIFTDGRGMVAIGSVGAPIFDSSGRTYVLGSSSNQTLVGQYVWGFGGNDTLTGTSANDFLSGGAGDDTITGGLGADIISGGTGMNTYRYAMNPDGSTRDSFVQADGGAPANHDKVHVSAGSMDRIALDGHAFTVWSQALTISAAVAATGAGLLGQLSTAFEHGVFGPGMAVGEGDIGAMLFTFSDNRQFFVADLNGDALITERDLVIEIIGSSPMTGLDVSGTMAVLGQMQP